MSGETTDVQIGSVRVQVTSPRQGSPTGVLLYPTIFGINGPMSRFAAELADLQLTVVVWDPYRGEPADGSPREMIERSKGCEDHAVVEDLKLVVDHMQTELGLQQIAGVGWCFGGRIGLLHAATDNRVTVLCAYNPTMLPVTPVELAGIGVTSRGDYPGQTMDEVDLAQRIVGPVQVLRPEHDFTQSGEYQALADALFRREAPTFYEYYPGAQHGFSYTPGAENERAHRFAWPRTLSLLSGLRPGFRSCAAG